MARGKFITDFERDMIRIGHSEGIGDATIARALRRTPASVGQQIKKMRAAGTLDDLPFVFVVEEIAEFIRKEGVIGGKR